MQSLLIVLFGAAATAAPALAQSGIKVFPDDPSAGVAHVPPLPPGLTFVQMDAGNEHAVAVRSDGSVVAWGTSDGRCNVLPLPAGLRYVRARAGYEHSVALRSDGSVVAWGRSEFGQCDVPPLPAGLSYVEIAAGWFHTAAVRSDGAIVAFGYDLDGQCDVPPPPPGLEFVGVAAGRRNTIALLSDGSVASFGPIGPPPPLPRGVTYVQVSASSWDFALALRSDGQIVGWGECGFDVCTVPPLPSGLAYVDVDAGMTNGIALRSDGWVVAWGHCLAGQCDVPELARGLRYVEVAEGNGFSFARYEGCPTCELPFCLGDGGPRSEPCPCTNNGASGRGCENSASTGGALLTARGSVDPDGVVLSTIGITGTRTTLFLQGRSVLELAHAFGDGLRCIGGSLKRLGAGSTSYPGAVDPPISVRSAALGDPIAPGTFRYYQVVYRDPSASFCTPASWNASNAVMVAW